MMQQRPPIYASSAERFLAYLIDTIIMLIPAAMLAALLSGSELAVLAIFISSLVYYTLFTASSWQATPGKRLLGMYVIRTDHRALTQRDALERFLAFCLPGLPIYASFITTQTAQTLMFILSLLWFMPILFTDEKIGYHDRICRTRVLVGKV